MTAMTCQIRTHKECSCEPQECRAIHLGTFTKDRASEAIQNTFPASHLMILVTVMMALMTAGLAVL